MTKMCGLDRKPLFGVIVAMVLFLCCNCSREEATIPIISWAGVQPGESEEVFPILKECGIDIHLGLYDCADSAIEALDAAQTSGLKVIPGFPQIKDSTDLAVSLLNNHPALYGYHLKDEPETWDIPWLKDLTEEIVSYDHEHPVYINLYPDWAWGGDEYEKNVDDFAEMVDVPFYSFDQYPVTEDDYGRILIRPGWYRNLEVISKVARTHKKPFWAFALTTSHHLGAPSPEAFYPVPTLGHLRLQVFSDLLYGAQAIQYFTASGVYDTLTHCKTSVFDVVRQVNSEIKAYSKVFHGCTVDEVWHCGDAIPLGTKKYESCEHVKHLDIAGKGGLISLLHNGKKQYLAVQNKDCVNPAILDIGFTKPVKIVSTDGKKVFESGTLKLDPGNIVLFCMN